MLLNYTPETICCLLKLSLIEIEITLIDKRPGVLRIDPQYLFNTLSGLFGFPLPDEHYRQVIPPLDTLRRKLCKCPESTCRIFQFCLLKTEISMSSGQILWVLFQYFPEKLWGRLR